MKKAIFFLLALMVSQVAFGATPVIHTDPLSVIPTTVVKTSDDVVKSTPGYVHSIIVTFKGVTIGDEVDLNDNSTAGRATRIRIMADGAYKTVSYVPAAPILFPNTGIYCDFTISGGEASAAIQYS